MNIYHEGVEILRKVKKEMHITRMFGSYILLQKEMLQ